VQEDEHGSRRLTNAKEDISESRSTLDNME
jgi:hypothetical protein